MRLPSRDPDMLRVAFVNHHGAVPSGAEKSLETYLRRIPDDIDPHVFLFEDGAYADQVRALGIPVHIVPASPRLMAVTRTEMHVADAVDGIGHVLRLARALKSCHVDLVVTNSMKAHVVGAVAARLCGSPAVTWLKDLPEGFALRLVRLVSRTCATERIACSDAVVRRLALARTATLVPPLDLAQYGQGLSRDEARTSLGLPRDKLIFSIVGRIAPWKGQDRFIRAAALVCARTDAVHFAVVGSPTFPKDHEFAPTLVELVERLRIAERVSFIPWLPDPRPAYAASDLICNASAAEPFGRTSVEAGAHGVPTLCFSDGGACEAVLPAVTGTVVPAGDIDAFAAAMVAYAFDPAALKRAGAAARVYVRRHDADRLADAFFAIVRRASLKGAHPHREAAARIGESTMPATAERG
jgi:glycosyltransferase involved in cell wall biosynthesis